jgi:hypothetical protein
MSKRLHAFFWIAIAYQPIAVAYLLFTAIQLAAVWKNFSHQDAIAIGGMMLLGSGPVVALYGAAIFSKSLLFQMVVIGASLFIAVTFPIITTYGGLAMVGAGICAWTIAFVAVGISGGIRLITAWKSP